MSFYLLAQYGYLATALKVQKSVYLNLFAAINYAIYQYNIVSF